MKASSLGIMVATALLWVGPAAQAQYKAPSQYFPKNSPIPGAPGGKPAAPKAPEKPAVPQQPKFKDVALNTEFFFLTDTNRAFPWTKLTATTAKNTKNGITQVINAATPVQKPSP